MKKLLVLFLLFSSVSFGQSRPYFTYTRHELKVLKIFTHKKRCYRIKKDIVKPRHIKYTRTSGYRHPAVRKSTRRVLRERHFLGM